MKKMLSVLLASAGAFCLLFHMTGCGSILAEEDAAAREDPKFWASATASDDSSTLSFLEYNLFSGKPYNDIYRFGEDILLVGEAVYEDALGDAFSDTSGEDAYEYSFELYSPWRNLIVRTLPHQTLDCDRYQVAGDTLFLFNDSRRDVSLYDTSLNTIGTYDVSALYEQDALSLFATEDPMVFLSFSEEENRFLRVDFSGDSVVATEYDSPYYETICGAASGGRLAISGVDPDSLVYQFCVLDSGSFRLLEKYPGCNSFSGSMSDQAFLGKTNEKENYWIYQLADHAPVYFQSENAGLAYVLPDNSFILEQQVIDPDSDDFIVRYTRYDTSGCYLSSFTYSCGTYDSYDYTYLSRNIAYFSEEELIFLLAFNANCEPVLLVWDTAPDAQGGDDLVFYDSEEELALATPSVYYPLYEEQSGTEYGYEVTLLSDSAAYDWGDLTEANEKASQLEDAYGVSIYIGPEVPEMIDYFSVEQRVAPSAVSSALDDLDEILSAYPEGFFSQLCFGENRGIRIYLAGSISGGSSDVLDEASAFVNEINSYLVMVLDISASWNWDYTINHEISHIIDRRLTFRSSLAKDALFSEDAWNDYNPSDFVYLDSYDGYEDVSDFTSYESYFVDSYGITFATEDRAELFGTAMSDYQNNFAEDSCFAAGTPTAEKYSFYCACIRDGFDTSGWASVVPWEEPLE
jgi:hypothetical protein